MLLIGFGALTINYTKVMTISLGACMLMCIFLKNESNDAMVMPIANTEAKLSVAHFNVSNVQDLDHLINTIDDLDVDLLSFQELTPDWNYILQEKLKTQYPYNMSIVRIDPYGMAMYSKENFASMDTFMFDNKPNLQAELLIDSKKISAELGWKTKMNFKKGFCDFIFFGQCIFKLLNDIRQCIICLVCSKK